MRVVASTIGRVELKQGPAPGLAAGPLAITATIEEQTGLLRSAQGLLEDTAPRVTLHADVMWSCELAEGRQILEADLEVSM